MKIMYLFLPLLASQLPLASPFMIRKELTENGVEAETNKTAPLATDRKAQRFLVMEGPNAPGKASEASSLGQCQEKCERNNFNLLTSLI